MEKKYNLLINNIGQILEEGRRKAVNSINQILVQTYWEIGRQIVEYEQKGKERAEYGSKLLDTLSKDLKQKYGKGFSKSNLIYTRLFYIKYQKSETLSHQLGWSHYFELLKIKYALGGITNKLFISKYKVYLPDKEELEREVGKLL